MKFATAGKPRIYLAGPDVFAPDRDAIFASLRAACENHGLVGVAPLDGGQSEEAKLTWRTPQDEARWIYDENIRLLRSCDGVMANLNGFRGVEPDSGTAFEVGFAAALGKPVALIVSVDKCWEERVEEAFGSVQKPDAAYDACHGAMIESFGLPANLMLAFGSCAWAKSPQEAARSLAEELNKIQSGASAQSAAA